MPSVLAETVLPENAFAVTDALNLEKTAILEISLILAVLNVSLPLMSAMTEILASREIVAMETEIALLLFQNALVPLLATLGLANNPPETALKPALRTDLDVKPLLELVISTCANEDATKELALLSLPVDL